MSGDAVDPVRLCLGRNDRVMRKGGEAGEPESEIATNRFAMRRVPALPAFLRERRRLARKSDRVGVERTVGRQFPAAAAAISRFGLDAVRNVCCSAMGRFAAIAWSVFHAAAMCERYASSSPRARAARAAK